MIWADFFASLTPFPVVIGSFLTSAVTNAIAAEFPGFRRPGVELIDGALYSDPGVHDGGWHSHGVGGKLNIHLDYPIHPKSGLERRLNRILYMQPGWQMERGGSLGFLAHDDEERLLER
jgi:hypothetical protein